MKIKIDLKKIKRFFKKVPETLAEKAFIVFLILFVFDSILGIFVFYRYTFPSQEKEIESSDSSLKLKEELFQSILGELEEAEERTKKADEKTYPDFFQAKEERLEERPEEPAEELTE